MYDLNEQENKSLMNSLQSYIHCLSTVLQIEESQFSISLEINASLFDISMRLIKKSNSNTLDGLMI